MSTVDYGFFNALTGPLQSANNIQQNRDAERVRQLQLQQQEFQLQQAESLRQEELQKQLNLASQDAHNEIFVNNAFKREKDAVDYQKWYQNYSGFGDEGVKEGGWGNDRDLGYTLLNAGGGVGYARTNISTCTKLPCNGDKWNNTNPNIEVCLIKWYP